MKTEVIFANDSPELVIHPDSDMSKVQAKIEELTKADYERVKHLHPGQSFEDYSFSVYWHTHTVNIEKL